MAAGRGGMIPTARMRRGPTITCGGWEGASGIAGEAGAFSGLGAAAFEVFIVVFKLSSRMLFRSMPWSATLAALTRDERLLEGAAC